MSLLDERIRSKLEELLAERDALEERLARPDIVGSPQYAELSQKYAKLKQLADDYDELQKLERAIDDAERWLEEGPEEEMEPLIQEELEENRARAEALLAQLKRSLIPGDPEDEKDAILEIRAGTGGEESALFAADLLRMYQRYAEEKGMRKELIEAHPTPLGGFKTIVFSVRGSRAFGQFKFESGVHRVQRVPETETSGRIHTSTATVAVLPEAEPIEVDVIDNDLEIETFRASGPGGQHVNKADTAVRITHLPTGITVSCQEERSQHQNKERALRLLRAKLKDQLEQEAEEERVHARRIQIGGGRRSEKIRTYNFPQNRVTDHRIELTLHRLEEILDGNLDLLIEPLARAYEEEQIAELIGS